MMSRGVQMQRNKISQLVRMSNRFGSHVDCCRIIKGNSYAHELAKFKRCFREINNGKAVLTEAVFEAGGKADLIIMDDAVIVEFMGSETLEECEKKIRKYPSILSVEFVKV